MRVSGDVLGRLTTEVALLRSALALAGAALGSVSAAWAVRRRQLGGIAGVQLYAFLEQRDLFLQDCNLRYKDVDQPVGLFKSRRAGRCVPIVGAGFLASTVHSNSIQRESTTYKQKFIPDLRNACGFAVSCWRGGMITYTKFSALCHKMQSPRELHRGLLNRQSPDQVHHQALHSE
jgi:hypothetical protein